MANVVGGTAAKFAPKEAFKKSSSIATIKALSPWQKSPCTMASLGLEAQPYWTQENWTSSYTFETGVRGLSEMLQSLRNLRGPFGRPSPTCRSNSQIWHLNTAVAIPAPSIYIYILTKDSYVPAPADLADTTMSVAPSTWRCCCRHCQSTPSRNGTAALSTAPSTPCALSPELPTGLPTSQYHHSDVGWAYLGRVE